MITRNYEFRFELKPGKFVFVPTKQSIIFGKRLIARVLDVWTPADCFYHLKKAGGHVAAMRPHLQAPFHASIDLTNFFGSISRTRVQRALKSVGIPNREALDIATESCVDHGGRKFLPYGFTQSMILATLVFEKSLLGSVILGLRSKGVIATVYVDDILISSKTLPALEGAYSEILEAIQACGFEVSLRKSEAPGEILHAFNCRITDKLELLHPRMELFREQLRDASENAKAAILSYVSVINSDQAEELSKTF